jgi:hypothetical protein
MVLSHILGLFVNPSKEWETIRDDACSIAACYASHVLFMAAIPAIAGYIGTTEVGWQIGYGHQTVKLAGQSALMISILFYIAMLVGVYSMGYMIHWMGKTYGAEQALSRCILLAAYTVTPLFLIGIVAIYPLLWLNLLLGLPALAYTVYLLYLGLPVMMGISAERGFLFSSAVLGVGLVALVALLAITALLWGSGIGPAFTSD